MRLYLEMVLPSKELRLNQVIWLGLHASRICVLVRRTLGISLCPYGHVPRKGHVRTWRNPGLPQTRKRVFTTSWMTQNISLELIPSKTVKKISICCLSQPLYGIFIWQLTQPNIEGEGTMVEGKELWAQARNQTYIGTLKSANSESVLSWLS